MSSLPKVAIVVGGSGAIGTGVVASLLRAGCRVVAVGRSQERLDELVRRHDAKTDSLAVHRADFTVEDQVEGCLREIKQSLGRLDFLIYTPGREPDVEVPLATYSTPDWDATFAVYVRGFFLSIREGFKTLEGEGHIVAVSSAVTRFSGDRLPPLHVGHYAAAKAALDELCKWARREAHERGLLLSRIAPGAVDSPFHRNAPPQRRPAAVLSVESLAKKIVQALMSGKEIDEVMVAQS